MLGNILVKIWIVYGVPDVVIFFVLYCVSRDILFFIKNEGANNAERYDSVIVMIYGFVMVGMVFECNMW